MTLAFYDLCAVLTPCGPLKALVEMAQSRNDGIPGLLYEAQVEEAEEEEVVSPAPPRPVSSPIREQRREPTKISSSSSDPHLRSVIWLASPCAQRGRRS